jgi:hypothetical protein
MGPRRAVVWVGDQPYFRLTPTVAVWMQRQVDALYPPGTGPVSAQLREATGLTCWLRGWTEAHYPPHQIWAAWQGRAELPTPPKPPPRMPGADAWKRRTHIPEGAYGGASDPK